MDFSMALRSCYVLPSFAVCVYWLV